MILERVGEEEEGGEMEGEGEGVNNMEGVEGRGRARVGAGDREKLHSIIIFFYHTRGYVAFRQPSVFVWWLALRAVYTTLQRCNAVQGFCRRGRRHGRGIDTSIDTPLWFALRDLLACILHSQPDPQPSSNIVAHP